MISPLILTDFYSVITITDDGDSDLLSFAEGQADSSKDDSVAVKVVRVPLLLDLTTGNTHS